MTLPTLNSGDDFKWGQSPFICATYGDTSDLVAAISGKINGDCPYLYVGGVA